uniref:Uncharacterized protein n=1 Tax=Schizophyllum commune (strain H4-8 / FGSC 9210) TaxID=578458 RepID=D8QF45_SCHCM
MGFFLQPSLTFSQPATLPDLTQLTEDTSTNGRLRRALPHTRCRHPGRGRRTARRSFPARGPLLIWGLVLLDTRRTRRIPITRVVAQPPRPRSPLRPRQCREGRHLHGPRWCVVA